MLQIEESRIGFVKGLISKNLKCTELIATNYAIKVAKIEAAIAAINSEEDMRIFIRDSKAADENTLFFPLKCARYEYEYASGYCR